jgi:hypothetical protein
MLQVLEKNCPTKENTHIAVQHKSTSIHAIMISPNENDKNKLSPIDIAEDRPDKPIPPEPLEHGGPKGPEPTRYGDWERKGRCVDF